MKISEAVQDLYVARLGPPSRRARFEVGGLVAEIFKWDADGNRYGVNLYVTIGASAAPMLGRSPSHRVEFFVGLLPARDEIASPLAALALYATRARVALDHGDSVPADGPLWPGTAMRRLLLLHPLDDIIPPLQLPDGLHVEFLQSVPVFESKLAYKSKHGAEALLRLWEQSRVPFWDPNRSPEPAFS